tara:strand:+ start:8579 stop:10624 length:2046 start_codon:yes stop_codon:yes gene_type:complete
MAQIWDNYGLSKSEWMNIDANSRAKITSQNKSSNVNTPKPDTTGAKDYLGLISQTVSKQVENLGLMTQIGKTDEAGVVAREQINSLIDQELTLRKQVVTQLGQVGSLQQQTSASVLDAAVQLHKFGIDTTRTFETLAEISDEVGKNLSISSEDLERLTLMSVSLNMTAQESAEVVKGFEQMGLSMGDAVDKTMEMAEVARMQGINVDKFMGDIAGRMDTLNSYNFADGVKGFARMAAQAQKLGLDMGKVVNLAEKVMSPEGAIELAANLQVLGGAAGDLADPFKLMYMATNDLEGLQKSLVGAGRDLAVFNEETNRLEIPPTSIRQIGALASELDMTREEFVRMMEQQHKFDMMQNQFSLDFLQSDDAAELQSFVEGMATMGEGGQFEIAVDDKMVKLQDLGVEQVEALRKQMEDQKMQDDKFAGMDERELMIQQLNALEVIAGTMETPGKALEASLIKNFPFADLNESMAGAAVTIDTETVQLLTDKLSQGIVSGLSNVVMGSPGEQENLEPYFGKQSTFDEMANRGLLYFNTGIEKFAGHFSVNDYATEGPASILSNQGVATVSNDDTVFAVDMGKVGQTNLGAGDLASTIAGGDYSTSFEQTNVNGGNVVSGMDNINVKQETSGTIKIVLDGKNLGNLDPMKILNNDQYIQILKSRFQQVSMTGKPDFVELGKGYVLN